MIHFNFIRQVEDLEDIVDFEDVSDSRLHGDKIYEKAKKRLEKEDITVLQIIKELKIPNRYRNIFNLGFEARYGRKPGQYRFFIKKSKPIVRELSKRMHVLSDEETKSLGGVIEVGGPYTLLAIVSRDKIQLNKSLSKMIENNWISKPGEHKRSNGLFFGVYQILSKEDSKDFISFLKSEGYEAFILKVRSTHNPSIPETLKNYAEYLVNAYNKLNHNT